MWGRAHFFQTYPSFSCLLLFTLVTDVPHGADCYPSRSPLTVLSAVTDIPQKPPLASFSALSC